MDNVQGAFAVPAHQKPAVADLPFMLIDDVMTAGVTLFEAAKTLQKFVAGPIYRLVIVRVN